MTQDSEAGFHAFERFLDEWSRRDFLRRMGAGAAWVGFLAGGSAFLEACGAGSNNPQGGTPSGTPTKGGHVIEGSIADVKSFNSALTSDVVSGLAQAMVYDSLYMNEYDGSQVPLLAKGMPQVSSDGKTYTITLADAKWTDGQPVTADDVKFTYDLMWDPAYKVVNSPRRGELTTYVKNITVKDPKTIVFDLNQVYAPFLSQHLVSYGIMPKHVWGSLAPADINTTEFNSKPPVTSGPFRDPQWVKGSQVTFTANKDYHRGAPNVDKWVYKVVPQATELLNQLKTGEIDVGLNIDPSQYDAAKAVSNLDVKSFTSLSFTYYNYNLDPSKTQLFQDKRVRQALIYALDRQAMVNSIYFGQGKVAYSTESPASWAFQEVQPRYTYDKSKAESLLDAAGFKKGADGIRAKGDLKLQFEMLTNKDNNARMNLLAAMQNQWKEIGVDATPKGVDFNLELVPQLTNTRTYKVLLLGFQWNTDPDQSQMFASRNTAPGGFNGMFYKNPDLDKVLNDAVSTLDKTKRKQLYKQMQEILIDDAPVCILLFANDIIGVNKRVQGFNPNPFANRYDGRKRYVKDVYVTDGK
jgi:peptide/nickel transport system substrate-binding protein